MVRSVLLIIAGVLAVMVGFYYLWVFWSQPRVETPEQLVLLALTADTLEEREAATARLTQRGRPVREYTRQLFDETQEPRIKAACVRGMGAAPDYGAMPRLLDALESESDEVRAAAGQAVQNLLRTYWDYRHDAPPAHRKERAAFLRKEWEKQKKSLFFRSYVIDELKADFD